MIEERTVDLEPAVAALEHLSDAANAGAAQLREIGHDLDTMEQQRARGWSWSRIVAASPVTHTLSRLAHLTATLGTAGGGFRRALARALRAEGMQVNRIADLFEVSRQRVSALVRSDPDSGAVDI
jgi:hypothetical protein